MRRLEGKVTLITGAATGIEGRAMGLGGASARLLAREGAKVVLTDVNDEMGELAAAQIRADGGEATYLHLDVTNEKEWSDNIGATERLYGGLDVLVHSAGITFRTTVEETTEKIWDAEMAVHAKGSFLGTKHAIPVMRKSLGGSIVLMSSIAGLVGTPSSTAYHAAKGAMRMFAKTAAVQYASEGIRVNSIHPGFIMTPMFEPLTSNPEAVAQRLAKVPLGRMGQPEEIAYLVLFLASDESRFITGTEIPIDGGYTAQ